MNIAMPKRLVVLTLGLTASIAQAQLATNLFIDTKAMSMGNAVTADPVGIMSIHFNPAGLTKLQGRQVQFSLQNIYLKSQYDFAVPDNYNGDGQLLDINDDPVAGQSGEASAAAYIPGVGIQSMDGLPVLLLPSAGISIKPEGSRFTFANAVYSPMAVGFAKNDDDPGRYQAKKFVMQRFSYLTPSFGYQVNDELSVGVSFLFSHHAVALEQDLRLPSILIAVAGKLQNAFGCFDEVTGEPTGNDPLVPLIALCGGKIGPYEDIGTLKIDTQESLSPSFNVGFLWEPVEWFAWGAVYQSGATANLKGTYELEYTDDFAGFFQKLQSSIFGAIGGAIFQLPTGIKKESGLVSTEQVFPQHFQTGIKLKFFEDFQFNFDLGWTDYDKWDYIEFKFDRPVSYLNTVKLLAPDLVTDTTLRQPLGFKSVWSPAFGFGYDLNSRIQLRAGFEPRVSSVPDDARSIQAHLGDATLYTMGMGYVWDDDSVVDFSIAFIQSKETIYADPQEENNVGPYSNSSNSLNRNCLTCTVTNPYPGLDVRTKLTIGAVGITYRTKF
jgi:long-subunit fatty acid transport protein